MTSGSITNVATVPQRSPFRYPGGKTWLVPEIRAWLRSLAKKPEIFVEPFAGGGVASLTAVFENLAQRAVMVERDENVAAVWRVILDDADWLAERILKFQITLENVKEELSRLPNSLREKAFQVLLRNRVQRGGIMATGASLIKSGENGRGISSRWYPETLAKRIRSIYGYRDRITFIEGDAFAVIPRFLENPNAVFFVDPPYTAGGKRSGSRLYNHSEVNHTILFAMMARAKGSFMMTYDEAEEVVNMAARQGFLIFKVPMKSTHHAKMYELLISPGDRTIAELSPILLSSNSSKATGFPANRCGQVVVRAPATETV